jgi:ATP-dependent Clp protease ATP-binding subunit ClpX
MEQILLDTMFDLPSHQDVQEVVINRGVVDNQDTPVKVYVKQPSEQTA